MCKNNNFKNNNAIGYNFKKDPIFIPASEGMDRRLDWMGQRV